MKVPFTFKAPALSHSKTRCGGFTLLELLIAVSIFAIVLAAINSVFYAAMRLERTASRSVEEAQPLEQTVSLIKRDLQAIVAPGGVLAGPLQPAAAAASSGGNNANMIPAGAVATGGGMGQQGSTVIYTASGALEEVMPWGDIQQVTYYLKAPIDRSALGSDLVRSINRNLLGTLQAQPLEQTLMGGVQRFQFSFFDGLNWLETWDTTTPNATTGATNTLPRAIKVQIDLAVNRGELARAPVQILVPVVVQGRTNQTQTAGGQP
jgi:type II secretion system protein J